MNEYDYEKFRDTLAEHLTEINRDIKRTERRLADLLAEKEKAQTAIDNVEREHMQRNDKY